MSGTKASPAGAGYLVLTRRVGEKIRIGADVVLTLVDILGTDKCRIGVEAPRSISVWRSEIAQRIKDGVPIKPKRTEAGK